MSHLYAILLFAQAESGSLPPSGILSGPTFFLSLLGICFVMILFGAVVDRLPERKKKVKGDGGTPVDESVDKFEGEEKEADEAQDEKEAEPEVSMPLSKETKRNARQEAKERKKQEKERKKQEKLAKKKAKKKDKGKEDEEVIDKGDQSLSDDSGSVSGEDAPDAGDDVQFDELETLDFGDSGIAELGDDK